MILVKNLKKETDSHSQIRDYNFLITKDWMMIILRKKSNYNNIYCNSLGYFGFLFFKD